MPELPEVETVKNSLKDRIIGLTITGFYKTRDNLRYKLSEGLESEIISGRITDVRRRAKYLIIDLNNSFSIIFHLGMSGRFTLQPHNYLLIKHDHVIFKLDSGQQLVFNDHRRFGMIYSFNSEILEEKFFNNLGLEPFSPIFDSKYLCTKLANRKTTIKNLLMDNKIVVGIGNIYASEILFLSRIHPARQGQELKPYEISNLVVAIKEVLIKSIKAGGSTIKDFMSSDGTPGYFAQELLVYGRKGQKCTRCNEIITACKQSGRTSFYCSGCQPLTIRQ